MKFNYAKFKRELNGKTVTIEQHYNNPKWFTDTSVTGIAKSDYQVVVESSIGELMPEYTSSNKDEKIPMVTARTIMLYPSKDCVEIIDDKTFKFFTWKNDKSKYVIIKVHD